MVALNRLSEVNKRRIAEWGLCREDPVYFIHNYCKIYDPQAGDWIPFHLWDEQREALTTIHKHQMTVVLKARQLGLSWLTLGYALWQMLFTPIATVLLFSKREDESIYLLSEERMRGMYAHLPDWMRAERVTVDSAKTWTLSNGSTARSFPSIGGDSYSATCCIIDEAAILPNLGKLLRSTKPTIDAGGKLIMISRANKDQPVSVFNSTYRAAKAGKNGWAHIFLPWSVRPERDQAWYKRTRDDIVARTGSDDDMKEQYPATDEEALAPSSRNKRIPAEWLETCLDERKPLESPGIHVPGLDVFKAPEKFGQYVAGMDCAEGLASSDDSVTVWLDAKTGEQVALLRGKLTTKVHARDTLKICQWYNDAQVMIENNNHGHAVIQWFEENNYEHYLLDGHNGKVGWTSNTLGKALMYDATAEAAKDGETIIRDYETYTQLVSIEKATLRAPEGEMDDMADAYALALAGIRLNPGLVVIPRAKARLD